MRQFNLDSKPKLYYILYYKLYYIYGEFTVPYLKKRGNIYYYQRRVPTALKHTYPKQIEMISLRTDSRAEAEQMSVKVNSDIEALWESMLVSGSENSQERYQQIINLSKQFGFKYRTISDLSQVPVHKLINRLTLLDKTGGSSEVVEATMGGASKPTITITDALETFWEISKHETMDKSIDQIRKWKNPRIKAVNNFIKLVGNKSLTDISRTDLLTLRDWWIDRILENNMANNSANKEIFCLKKMVCSVNDHLNLEIPTEHIFLNVTLPKGQKAQRLPFEQSFIQNEILHPKYHVDLLEEAKLILYVLADTGARPGEIVGLKPEDIFLDAEIPHIKIRPRKGRRLKTKFSERDIPLVGCALWAFQQAPNGFPHYHNLNTGTDSLSGTLMRHLRAKNLLPSENHTLYSLRHSFQDRLTEVAAVDRVQAQLMGHKFPREQYGQGASLKTLQEWMEKIALVPNFTT